MIRVTVKNESEPKKLTVADMEPGTLYRVAEVYGKLSVEVV